MSETIATDEGDASQPRGSWTPMIGLFLAQVLMSFNVAALPISLGGMVEDFGVPPTVASSTIVVYGLAVAALVMTGAKLGQRIGWALIFRCVLGVFAASSLAMILRSEEHTSELQSRGHIVCRLLLVKKIHMNCWYRIWSSTIT